MGTCEHVSERHSSVSVRCPHHGHGLDLDRHRPHDLRDIHHGLPSACHYHNQRNCHVLLHMNRDVHHALPSYHVHDHDLHHGTLLVYHHHVQRDHVAPGRNHHHQAEAGHFAHRNHLVHHDTRLHRGIPGGDVRRSH